MLQVITGTFSLRPERKKTPCGGLVDKLSWVEGTAARTRVFSCSPCPPLTEDIGRALGFTRPSDIRVAGRLRRPWLRGSANIFAKWRIKGNKGKPLCEQPSPLSLGICQQASVQDLVILMRPGVLSQKAITRKGKSLQNCVELIHTIYC